LKLAGESEHGVPPGRAPWARPGERDSVTEGHGIDILSWKRGTIKKNEEIAS